MTQLRSVTGPVVVLDAAVVVDVVDGVVLAGLVTSRSGASLGDGAVIVVEGGIWGMEGARPEYAKKVSTYM